MSFSKLPRRCAQNESKSDCLIVIDSDEEDEVIFVNEDGGQTLAEHEALITPGFLESLQKNNELEVRNIFNNVVKITPESNSNPVIIERSLNESPTDEIDEEQIELPNYEVQLNLSENSNSLQEIDCSSNVSSGLTPKLGRIDGFASLAPISSKPIIKLAPLSRLVDTQFVPLSETVNKLGIKHPPQNVPQVKKQTRQRRQSVKNVNKQQRTSPKQTSHQSPTKSSKTITCILTKPDKPSNKSPIIESLHKSEQQMSNQSPNKPSISPTKARASSLLEKKAILQKYIPGGSASSHWTWEQTIKKAINFICELRKSDCELDIAEEALLQSNIKLNIEYDKLLQKIYQLCPSENDNDNTLKKVRNTKKDKIETDSVEKSCKTSQPDDKENVDTDSPILNANPAKLQENVNNEDYKLLYNLLGEVKESAKMHLLNFDPQIPFNEFLPSSLLDWDRPKPKTELLDELMFLENAIEKCSSETEKMCKVSHEKDIFKYESDLDIFKKEFNLECENMGDDLLPDYCNIEPSESEIKNEKSDDTLPTVESSLTSTCNENSDKQDINNDNDKNVQIDESIVNTKNVTPPKPKGKKRQPWNKGLSKKKANITEQTKIPEVLPVVEQVSPVEESLNENTKDEHTKEPEEVINKDDDVETILKAENRGKKQVKKKAANKSKTQGKMSKQNVSGKSSAITKNETIQSETEEQTIGNDDKNDESDDIDEVTDTKKPNKSEPKCNENNKAKSTKILLSVERINSLIKANELNKIDTFNLKSNLNNPNENVNVEQCDEEPRRKLRRKRYIGEARTTRSFVKKCSEVMDDMDQEVVAFLSTSKKDKDSDSSGSDADEGHLVIDENASNKDESVEENKTDEKRETEEIPSEVVQSETIIQQKSPRKKKRRHNWGYTKRRSKKSKVQKQLTQTTIEPADEEKNSQVDESQEISSTTDDKDIDKEDSSKGKDKLTGDLSVETSVKENVSNQIISSCFSIDPSMFDNINDDGHFDGIVMNVNNPIECVSDDDILTNETKSIGEKESKETPGESITKLCEPTDENDKLLTDSPTSPLALTNKSDSINQQNVDMSDNKLSDIPLDFSKKIVNKNTPDADSLPQTETGTQPLNLSNKSNISPPTDEVIDFSIKSKSGGDERILDKIKENKAELGGPQNSPCDLSVNTPLTDVQTPFKPVKQIFPDPKIKDTSIDTCLKDLTQNSPSVESVENVKTSQAKDNMLNEITDILADLTSGAPSDIDFNLSSNDKDDVSNCGLLEKGKGEAIHQSGNPTENSTGITIAAGTNPLISQESANSRSELTENQISYNTDNSRISLATNIQYHQIHNSTLQPQTLGIGQFINAPGNHFQSPLTQSQETQALQQILPMNIHQAFNLQNYNQIGSASSNMIPYQSMMQNPQGYIVNNQQAMAHNAGINMQQFALQSHFIPDQYTSNLPQFDQNYLSKVSQNSQQMSIRDPRLCVKDQGNINDPRIIRRLSIQSQESNSSDNSDKQMIAFNSPLSNQGYMNFRDPRLAKKLTSTSMLSPDSPFRCNTLQVNHLISEVIKSNNFENFLMTQKGNQILNQNLEDEEEDLNLNRSDFDEGWDDEENCEEKQRQNLLRKSIDKIIVMNLDDEKATSTVQRSKTVNESYVQTVSERIQETSHVHQRNKRDSVSSEDSFEEQSGFIQNRVIRSPPMVRRRTSDDESEAQDVNVETENQDSKNITDNAAEEISFKKSTRERATKNQTARKTIVCSSDDDNESDADPKKSPSKTKKKLSIDEYYGRKNSISKKEGKYYQDDDYKPGKNVKNSHPKTQNITRKRIIESDEESCDSKRTDDNTPLKHKGIHDDSDSDDGAFSDEKAELSDETSDHLKRISSIRHRKLEESPSKMKTNILKSEPPIRRTKFLDELPPTDVSKALLPTAQCPAKKNTDKTHGLSKLEKHLLRDNSPKSTSRVVRKTITTEHIVTKRLSNDSNSSNKKIKLCPDKEKKVFVQERITLKVNERSGLSKKGINFKCDALKEGEILKVVGGKLVRVRKKLSESDEEIERERSKLHKSLKIKFKKKTDCSSTIDNNPYKVLSGDNFKSSVLEEDKTYKTTSKSDINSRHSLPKYDNHKKQCYQNITNQRSSTDHTVNDDIRKDQSDISRSSSIDSSDNNKHLSTPLTRLETINQSRLSRSDSEGSPSVKSSPTSILKNRGIKNTRWCPRKDDATASRETDNLVKGFKSFNDQKMNKSNELSKTDVKPCTVKNPSPDKIKDIDERSQNYLDIKMRLQTPENVKSFKPGIAKDVDMRINSNIDRGKNLMERMRDNTSREQDVKKCMELAKKQDMTVANKPQMELARKDDEKPIDSNAPKNSDSEIFQRRTGTNLRDDSSLAAMRRGIQRHSETMTVRSEWTEVTENSHNSGNRSILRMMQSGQINIYEITHRQEKRSWRIPNQDCNDPEWDYRTGRDDRRDQPPYSRHNETLDNHNRDWNRRYDSPEYNRSRSRPDYPPAWDRNREPSRSQNTDDDYINRDREWSRNSASDYRDWNSRGPSRIDRSESQRYGYQDVRGSPPYRDREQPQEPVYRDHPQFGRYSDRNRFQQDQYCSREENYRGREAQYHNYVPPMVDRRVANKTTSFTDVRHPINQRPPYQTNFL